MKKAILFICTLIITLFLFTSPLFALTVDGGRTVNIREDVDDNLYLWGGAVSVRSNINGDLFVAGGRFNLNGDIADDLTAIGAFGYVGGNVGGDVRITGGIVTLNGQVEGEVTVASGIVIIDTTCLVKGDLLVSGGSVNMLGEVEGDLIASGGSIEILGDVSGNAEIRNAAALNVRKTATIGGDLVYSSGREAGISEEAEIKGDIIFNERIAPPAQASASELVKATGIEKNLITYAATLDSSIVSDSAKETLLTLAEDKPGEEKQTFWGSIAGFFSGIFAAIYVTVKISYFLGMFIFGIVLILAIPALFRRFNDRMKSSPGQCASGGAITLFGVPIGVAIIWAIALILLITVVGAAFSFILFAAGGIIAIIYGVLVFVSTVFLSYLIGELILSKSKLDPAKYGVRVLAFFIGFIILEILYAIPVIGQICQFFGILFGLGGLAIIIYEWMRYKENPFKAPIPVKAGRGIFRRSTTKRYKS